MPDLALDIMVDIDDVIMPWAETVHLSCGELGLHDGKPYTSWQMWDDYGCTKEDWLRGVQRAVENGLYTSTLPYPGAVEAINLLRWEGHRIHIVTARGFMAKGKQIQQWTKDYLRDFGIGHDSLVFAKDKAEAMFLHDLRFDLAVDDGVHNYLDLARAGVEVWLLDAPHNQSFEAERRVSSLWDFAKIAQQRYAERTYQEVSA